MFEHFLAMQFGIHLPPELVLVEKKKTVYVASRELLAVNYPRLSRIGFLAGKKESIFGPKPSLDFVLAFGHLATKNVLRLSPADIEKLYHNEKLPMEVEGLVLVQDEQGNGMAIGHGKNGFLFPLIPKNRLLKHL